MDGMRILAFVIAPIRQDDIAGFVHVVIGRGREIRPVRLDVRQVQAPRGAAISVMNSIALSVLIRRFRMFLGRAGSPAWRINHRTGVPFSACAELA